MNELIDHVYDVEKISGEVAAVLAELNKVSKNIEGFTATIDNLTAATRKAKGIEDLTKNSKDLNDVVIKGGVEMKRYEAEVQKLKEKTEQLTTSEKAASIEIAKARIELAAATKATKDAALEQIVLEAETKGLAKNYYSLKQELAAAEKAFKSLTLEEQKGAKGSDLMKKYNEIAKAVNETDEAFGHFQNRVGNYEGAAKSLKSELKEIVSQLAQMKLRGEENSEEYAKLAERGGKLKDTLADVSAELKNTGSDTRGIDQVVGAFQALGAAAQVAEGASALFGAENEDVQKSIQKLVAIQSVLNGVQEIGNALQKESAFMIGLNTVKAKAAAAWKIVLTNLERTFGITATEAWAAATLGVSLLITGIVMLIANFDKVINGLKSFFGITNEFAATEAKVKSLTKAIEGFGDSTKLIEDRMKAEGKSDKEIFDYKKKRYNEELKMHRERYISLSGITRKLTDEEKESQKESAEFVKNSAKEKFAMQTSYIDLVKKENQKITEEEKKENEKIIAARRRLEDSKLSLLKDGKEKDLAISNENYNRQIEDLQRNGELTTELLKNLKKKQKNEVEKIENDYKIKALNDDIKLDEIILSQMEKSGEDTLNFQKKLLQKKMEAEILAGGDLVAIQLKYQYLSTDLEEQNNDKKIEAFKKTIEKQSEILTDGYKKQELELKKQYAKDLNTGKKTDEERLALKEKYEKDLADLQLNAMLDLNNQTIASLEKILSTEKMSEDKRAELSKKLADLKIANENAITDAVIKNNEEQVKSDDDAKAKRVEVAKALASATQEVFGAIADYQIQQSEQKIAALEAEQAASDANFEKEQEKLDGAIMSDETRAEKQKEINEKKAAADKVIADKIQAEKIKQAKWDKANKLAQAIITTGLAILNASLTIPFIPLGLIAAGTAATMGAIQVATIASQPIPAYEDGGITGSGLALWGEKRPEVAVTPSGDVMLAEKPTISNFDAGTRIYKSVSDYENAMNAKNGGGFSFDYDKMGEKMKPANIVLDSRGLWGIVSKQNARRTMINRRYNIN